MLKRVAPFVLLAALVGARSVGCSEAYAKTVTSPGGGSSFVPPATSGHAGTMSAADKAKLDAMVPMVDRIAVASVATSDLTITGLNGDTDCDYELTGDIIYKANSTSTGFYLRPFGASDTGLSCLFAFNAGTANTWQAGGTSAPTAGWFIVSENASVDVHLPFRATFTSKSGRARMFWSNATSTRVSAGIGQVGTWGWTLDTVSTVSAVTIHSNTANAIQVGSTMRMRSRGACN